MAIATGLPADIVNLIQSNFLQKAFQQSLRPVLKYRREALREMMIGREMGETFTQTRRGLMTPVVTPTAPGVDITPSSYTTEQWTATLARYTGGIDTRLPNSAVQIVNKFLEDATAMAEQAGWSLDRLSRNTLWRSYLGGDTLTVTAITASTTSVDVAALNGFRFALSNGKMVPVSASTPLTVTIDGTANTVVGVLPDDTNFPDGPGTLTVGTAIATLLVRKRVVSSIGPTIVRPSGIATVDAMTTSSFAGYDMLLAMKRILQVNRVPVFPDGTYHMHFDPQHLEQSLRDSAFKQLFQGQPNAQEMRDGLLVRQLGITFYDNTDNVAAENSTGGTTNKGTASAIQVKEFGAETTNQTGVKIKRSILIGQRCLSEFWIPESAYLAEQQDRIGPYGYQGRFLEGTGGFEAMLDGIRYIVRPPQDRALDVYSQGWSFSGDWVAPTDLNAPTSAAVYKRAVVMESCGV